MQKPAPGIKSTELWVSLIGMAITLAVGLQFPHKTEILGIVAGILGLLAANYTWARTWLKATQGNAQKPASPAP